MQAQLDAVITRRLEAAHRRVATARGLAFHPLLAAAFEAGDLSFEHARVISACLRHLPVS